MWVVQISKLGAIPSIVELVALEVEATAEAS